jgi:hypothetical protein
MALTLATVLSMASNMTASHLGAAHYENNKNQKPFEIFDLGHEILPQIKVSPIFDALTLLVWVPFVFMAPGDVAARVQMDLGYRWAFLFFLRAITTTVTILPKQKDCDASKWTWRELFAPGACYDKIFSGHAATATLVSLALVKHGVWPAWAGWTYGGGISLLMLVSRGHYTVDVVLGVVLALLTWTSTIFM